MVYYFPVLVRASVDDVDRILSGITDAEWAAVSTYVADGSPRNVRGVVMASSWHRFRHAEGLILESLRCRDPVAIALVAGSAQVSRLWHRALAQATGPPQQQAEQPYWPQCYVE